MTRELDSLVRGPLAMAAALAVGLLVLWALVRAGFTEFIVPQPEQVGQHFFSSLKSHDFGAAREALSDDLQQTVSAEDLRALTARLDAATNGIEQASGEDAQVQGEAAMAQIAIKLKNGAERTVDVPLRQDNGLWTITSLAPLETLIGP